MLYYIPLEPYQARYTLQLTKWNTDEFDRLGVPYHLVTGNTLDTSQEIKTGSVLDAHGRSYYALSQTMELIRLHSVGAINPDDIIFFEDMFHPGIEALPYLFNQIDTKPRVYVRCLAQTVDPDDFVHRSGMFRWMRHYELMVDEFVDGILAASEELVAHLRIAGFTSPIYVTGLPFGKAEVQSRVPPTPWDSKSNRVVFAARWDTEKQPRFYLEVARRVKELHPEIEFSVLSGSALRSNDPELLVFDRALVSVYDNLSKDDYYRMLSSSKLLFNCALQDWVSNTISEASALGTKILYPAYRSFPEACFNDPQMLYLPWSVDDAVQKIISLVVDNAPQVNLTRISDYQNETVERTLKVFSGEAQPYLANDNAAYRKTITTKSLTQ